MLAPVCWPSTGPRIWVIVCLTGEPLPTHRPLCNGTVTHVSSQRPSSWEWSSWPPAHSWHVTLTKLESITTESLFRSTCQFSAKALQQLSDRWRFWRFQDNFASTAGTDSKIYCNSVSALCEGWLQCISWVMQGLLTLQNHLCKNQPLHFARISVSLTDLEKLNC